MRITLPESGQSVFLEDVSWGEFEQILDTLQDHPGKRVTYDRGRLEIVSPSELHEWIKELIGGMIQVLTRSWRSMSVPAARRR